MNSALEIRTLSSITISGLTSSAAQFTSSRKLARFVMFGVPQNNSNTVYLGDSNVSNVYHMKAFANGTASTYEIPFQNQFLIDLTGFWAVATGGTTDDITLFYF